MALGRHSEALTWLRKGEGTTGEARRQLDGIALAYALVGNRDQAQTLLSELEDRARTSDQVAYSIAMVETGLGHIDKAIAWLNRAYDDRSANLWLVNSELKFDTLRADARFENLLHRMHFPGH